MHKNIVTYVLACCLIVMATSFAASAEGDVVKASDLVKMLSPQHDDSASVSGAKFRGIKLSGKKATTPQTPAPVEQARAVASAPTRPAVPSSSGARADGKPSAVLYVFFVSGTVDIADAKSWQQLDEVGKALSSNELKGVKLEIGGHTDDVGTEEYNQNLSYKRARMIYQYLNTKYGVSGLEVKGYGETMPIATNKTPEGRGKNRRVVITRLN